jgi:hypothetical protein
VLEVHLLDFDRDIYGRHVDVNFLHKLRSEAKFDSLDALKAQIARDVDDVRTYFKSKRRQDPWLITARPSTCPTRPSRCAATSPAGSRAGSQQWQEQKLYQKIRVASAKGAPASCSTTDRPMPMATSTSATR